MAAIYMWPVDDQTILTTTLYPVEVVEAMVFGASAAGGSMGIVPEDHLAITEEMQTTPSYIQVRWFYEDGPYEDHIGLAESMGVGSYIQVRWFYEDGPYSDALAITGDLQYITVTFKGVQTDTPDETLQLSTTISSGCTMELI
jgi:hypothetical protein